MSPDRALTFPSINYVRNVINKAATRPPCNPSIPVVLDCSHISSADFTAAKGFKAMISDFKMRGQELIFYNTQESVLDTFVGANVEFNVVHSIAELHECLNGEFVALPDSCLTFWGKIDLKSVKLKNPSKNQLEQTFIVCFQWFDMVFLRPGRGQSWLHMGSEKSSIKKLQIF